MDVYSSLLANDYKCGNSYVNILDHYYSDIKIHQFIAYWAGSGAEKGGRFLQAPLSLPTPVNDIRFSERSQRFMKKTHKMF